MGNKRKRTRNRRGMQVVTLCISTTMVLILLGMVVFSVLMARNLSNHMKENLTVTVMLKDYVTVNQAHRLCRDLYHRPYARNIDYISKEQAQKDQIKELGSDPSEFLGFNPFSATLEIQLKSDYANRDSLKWIVKEIKKDARVSDIAYMEDLVDQVNYNLSRISIILFVLDHPYDEVGGSFVEFYSSSVLEKCSVCGSDSRYSGKHRVGCLFLRALSHSARHFVNSRMGGTHHYRLCCAPVWCAHHIPVCMACSQ